MNIDNLRILVIGSPGSGKTIFAKKLANILHVPLYHLDDLYWGTNWIRVSSDKMVSILHKLCSSSSWIIDGNHFKTLEIRASYANLVIYLDIPVSLCLWRFLLRSIKRFFGEKSTLPKKIKFDKNYRPKFHIEWHLIKLIVLFKFKTKPKILDLLNNYNLNNIRLTSLGAVETYINSLSRLIR
ncbi:MAG: AAA family ATPase [Candidatus Aquirickettsiella gammari]|jgi:adenylate kinase family enzyme|uniref:AAA family ATPase n=1 Tax=Candidatus Aquirickettsiella gammari TaxID=2016198 RepID=A0A370CJI8_9COXI|nr:MAG: AAA family ATPase [Candidatus Aquirickettsiella gammari]